MRQGSMESIRFTLYSNSFVGSSSSQKVKDMSIGGARGIYLSAKGFQQFLIFTAVQQLYRLSLKLSLATRVIQKHLSRIGLVNANF